MNWTLPGTTISTPREDADRTRNQFDALFLAGGLTLSQVSSITGLEPYTIQNWVKRGFLPPPERKRYTLEQLCRIININMLKNVLPMERICGMLSYINGHLDDESDDIIPDSKLYFMFVRLAAHYRDMNSAEDRNAYIDQALADYAEPVPGAKQRVKKVLCIMLTAWASAQLKRAAESMLSEIE